MLRLEARVVFAESSRIVLRMSAADVVAVGASKDSEVSEGVESGWVGGSSSIRRWVRLAGVPRFGRSRRTGVTNRAEQRTLEREKGIDGAKATSLSVDCMVVREKDGEMSGWRGCEMQGYIRLGFVGRKYAWFVKFLITTEWWLSGWCFIGMTNRYARVCVDIVWGYGYKYESSLDV